GAVKLVLGGFGGILGCVCGHFENIMRLVTSLRMVDLRLLKIIRGYGGGAIAATQDLSDFFGLEDGKFGRAIINNSKNKMILNLEPDEAEYVREVLKLSRSEIRSITQFERGEALISSNSNKVPVMVKASKVEAQMITTDRGELEMLLRARQEEENS
ncbi:MAG: hypothetical protein LBS96_07670, partial [Oscillospiraceae bacterium]|nr:hypothetical protein [Oscillospiraceae bacterium]